MTGLLGQRGHIAQTRYVRFRAGPVRWIEWWPYRSERGLRAPAGLSVGLVGRVTVTAAYQGWWPKIGIDAGACRTLDIAVRQDT